MRISRFGLALTVLAGVLLAGACGGPPTLRTQSLSQVPTVDGTLSDWEGTLTRVGDESVSMSVFPSDSTVYLALLIPDQSLIRAVAEQGLVVWVDPSGEQAHTYGVRYPLGLRAQRAERLAGAPTSNSSQRSLVLDDLLPSDLAVIRNDTVRHRMPAGLSSALEAKATLETGALICEIAVPVSPSASNAATDERQHGLHAPLGDAVAVGLETPDPEDDTDLLDRSQGIPSVTGRGGRGRRGRSPRGRRRGRRGQPSSPSSQAPEQPTLDLWTRVVVANGS
ncbi:MAG: hypothetical protein BRD26_05200 [Bacteroidetes bacterium QH_1_64_81]|nr:MAG: hypothetical protein BRD26_05200 [Bacteroidetes bacterium QH_1_64_81]